MMWRSPVSVAIWAMALFAVLFEPLREVALSGQTAVNVSGVGGVGGLANLIRCTSNSTDLHNFKNEYCYEKGSLGPLTIFEALTILFWVGPLLVACFLHITRSHSGLAPSMGSLVLPIWISMNIMWFSLPALRFGLGLKEIEGAGVRQVLAVALAAAHPLSWNLAIVVIPTGGILAKLLSGQASKKQWFPYHRMVGYSTSFWACLHGFGELIYFCSTKKHFHSFWAIVSNGEVLLYWSGLLALVILVCHTVVAYTRRQLAEGFRDVHRVLAALLLLAAATHWWPFSFFFLPTTALHGMAWAAPNVDHWSIHRTAKCLIGALTTALLFGLYPVWYFREVFMMSAHANLYLPFVFPPLSVTNSTLVAYTWTKIFCMIGDEEASSPNAVTSTEEGTVTEEITPHTPLLNDA